MFTLSEEKEIVKTFSVFHYAQKSIVKVKDLNRILLLTYKLMVQLEPYRAIPHSAFHGN